MLIRIDHVQLAMPRGEEDKARAFFVGLLEMTEEPKPTALLARGGCWFRSGECVIHYGVEDDFRPQRKGHPALIVRDVDALARKLGDSGCEVVWDDAIPGVRRFYVDDPFGNRLEFVGNITV